MGETIGGMKIRAADPSDVPLILELIRELAGYERLADQAVASEESLARHLFGPAPRAEVLIADDGNNCAGFALFFHSFSTFLGRPGLYLEDLFVRPAFRGKGIGRRLLGALAQIAEARECGRMEWAVLDWNESAIGFYRAMGAVPMNDWTVFRLSGEALHCLAGRE